MNEVFLHHFQRLVAENTVSSLCEDNDQSNQRFIHYLANALADVGASIEIFPVVNSRKKYNLLATFKGHKTSQGGLLLSGHTDTVAFNADLWHSDPFKLCEKNGKYFGLGSVDMKNFFAIILAVLGGMKGQTLNQPLYVLATADEETTMCGAAEFVKTLSARSEFSPKLAIIGEPTELRPIHAHKGHIATDIAIVGQGGHASNPANGINAIEVLYDVMGQLQHFKQQLKQHRNPLFAVDFPTVNLGRVAGGDSVNRIAAWANLQLEIRPLPQMSVQHIERQLQALLSPIATQHQATCTLQHLHPPIDAYFSDRQSPSIQQLETITRQNASAVDYCTEASFLQHLCDTVVLGAGSIKQAHQANEFIEKSQIDKALPLFERIIRHYTA